METRVVTCVPSCASMCRPTGSRGLVRTWGAGSGQAVDSRLPAPWAPPGAWAVSRHSRGLGTWALHGAGHHGSAVWLHDIPHSRSEKGGPQPLCRDGGPPTGPWDPHCLCLLCALLDAFPQGPLLGRLGRISSGCVPRRTRQCLASQWTARGDMNPDLLVTGGSQRHAESRGVTWRGVPDLLCPATC